MPRLVRRPSARPAVTGTAAVIPVGVGSMTVARGMRLKLTAFAMGTPTPTISWYKNGKQIRSNARFEVGSDGSLSIRRVNRRDAGTFEVRAVNSVGRDSDTVRVQVAGEAYSTSPMYAFCNFTFVMLERPRLSRRQTVDPISPIPDTDRTVYPGQTAQILRGRTATLAAGASGIPTPEISWRLQSGRRLRTGQSHGRFSVAGNGDLQISNVKPRDSGRYEVFPRNVAGMDKVLSKQKTSLTVFGKLR